MLLSVSAISGAPADNISGPAYTLLNTRASQNQSQFLRGKGDRRIFRA
jgi:hypothetical protein